MVLEIQEVKYLRKKLGLTQYQLAKRSGVSQSLIAKIESGRLDPTYSNAKKILAALEDLGKKHEDQAKDIMLHRIISITPNTLIKDAIVKMKKYGFSQLPVIDDNKVIGFVTEILILNALLVRKGKYIEDIMESAPPVVSLDTSTQVISHLLMHFQMVLVSNKGRLVGAITKTDLLDKMYKSRK